MAKESFNLIPHDNYFKIGVFGCQKAGKSNLINRYVTGEFQENISGNLTDTNTPLCKDEIINNQRVRLGLYDHLRFDKHYISELLVPDSYKNDSEIKKQKDSALLDAGIIVIDLSIHNLDRENVLGNMAYRSMDILVQDYLSVYGSINRTCIVVVTKCDMRDSWKFTLDDVRKKAEGWGHQIVGVFEVSAKTGENIDSTFKFFADFLLKNKLEMQQKREECLKYFDERNEYLKSVEHQQASPSAQLLVDVPEASEVVQQSASYTHSGFFVSPSNSVQSNAVANFRNYFDRQMQKYKNEHISKGHEYTLEDDLATKKRVVDSLLLSICANYAPGLIPFRRSEVLKYLLSIGATVNATDDGDKRRTPISFCAENNLLAVADILIAAHADIDKCDLRGWAPIHYAIRQKHVDMVSKLVSAGASLSVLVHCETVNGEESVDLFKFCEFYEIPREIVSLISDAIAAKRLTLATAN